jgi:hypothetical protein
VNPWRGQLTDRSGTLLAANVPQEVMPFNPNRKYLFFQNVSAADLWINFGPTAATMDQPSIRVPAGGTFVMEMDFVTNERMTVIGGTVGQAYTCKEA